MFHRKRKANDTPGTMRYSPDLPETSPEYPVVRDKEYEYYVESVSDSYPGVVDQKLNDLIAEMQDEGWDYLSQTSSQNAIHVTFRRLRLPGNRPRKPNVSIPVIIPRRTTVLENRRGCGTYSLLAVLIITGATARFHARDQTGGCK
jgi:hypothetical protein